MQLIQVHQRGTRAAQPAADTVASGTLYFVTDEGVIEESVGGSWVAYSSTSSGAPTTADYLVGTSNGSLSAEIVVGTTPGGELGGTWGSPTIDATHSGSSHDAIPYTPTTTEQWNSFSDPGSAQDALDQLAARVALLERAQEASAHERITDQIFAGSNITFTESDESNTLTISGSAGGAGALTLVEAKTLTSDTTTVTFSGLDGNTDGMYLLIARIHFVQTCHVDVAPNGAVTNVSQAGIWDKNGNDAAGQYIMNVANGDDLIMNLLIHAKYNPNGQAFIRGGTGTSTRTTSGSQVVNFLWNDSTSNLTSLAFIASTASGIGNGSMFELYKYSQS